MSIVSERPPGWAPPAVALVISSPAILSALSGSTSPIRAFGIVVAVMSICWAASAAGFRIDRPTDRPTPGQPAPDRSDGGTVALGRIEPVRVPASMAIPGTPPPSSSPTEGPVP